MTEVGGVKKSGGEKAPKNIVHEQAILIETIRKELRDQRLCEEFSINPFVKSIHKSIIKTTKKSVLTFFFNKFLF